MGLIIGPPLGIYAGGGGSKAVQYLAPADAEFTYRQTAGGVSIGKGKAKIDKVKGKTVVWNQVIQNGDFDNGDTGWSATQGATLSVTNNKATVVYSAGQSRLESPGDLPLVSGHKYLVSYYVTSSDTLNVTAELSMGWQKYTVSCTASIRTKVAGFITAGADNTRRFIQFFPVFVTGQVTPTLVFEDIRLHDLTLMFGAGNEPATVAEFEAMYPLPYYAYNAGELVNNAATGIESVGFNQWDEEWEVGGFFAGEKRDTSNYDNTIRSKNYISIFPNTTYYIKSSCRLYFNCFDADKKYIGAYDAQADTEFTTPADARYMWLRSYANTYGTTYNYDICINISDASINGKYFPRIITDGLKSAGSVYDEIHDGKYIKRIEKVDLGTLEWSAVATYGDGHFSSANHVFGSEERVCSKYSKGRYSSEDKVITLIKNNVTGLYAIGISDSSFTNDAAAFKTAMSGVMLYYELETPETYTLDAKLPTKYKVEPGGTEKRLPEDTSSAVNAPFSGDIAYPKP